MSAWWTSAFVALWLLVMIIAVILLGYLRRVTAVLERAELAVTSGQVNLGGARVGMQVEPFTSSTIRAVKSRATSSSRLLRRT